jgi:hypothetical protein
MPRLTVNGVFSDTSYILGSIFKSGASSVSGVNSTSISLYTVPNWFLA